MVFISFFLYSSEFFTFSNLSFFPSHNTQTVNLDQKSAIIFFMAIPMDSEKNDANMRLEALLLEGLASGDGLPLNEDLWGELKADAAKILNVSRKAVQKSVDNQE